MLELFGEQERFGVIQVYRQDVDDSCPVRPALGPNVEPNVERMPVVPAQTTLHV